MKIDINKKYRYRNGKPARILCVDGNGKYPIVAIGEEGGPTTHTELGWFYADGTTATNDLIEVREPREWVIRSFHNGRPAIWSGPNMEPEQEIRVREIID